MKIRLVVATVVVATMLVPASATASHPPPDPADPVIVDTSEVALDVVADSSIDRVFVAGNGGVRIYGFDGTFFGTVADQAGAVALALDATRQTLYVALRDIHAVSAIDTTTLLERHRWGLGQGVSPFSLAVGGGRLWIGTRSFVNAVPEGRLVSVDPADAESAVRQDRTSGFYGWPALAFGGGTLAAVNTGSTPATLRTYDVVDGTLTERADKWNPTPDGSTPAGLVVSPDGQQIFWAAGGGVSVLNADDLAVVNRYPTEATATAVAVSEDGEHVITGAGAASPDPEPIKVYRAGESVADRVNRAPAVNAGGLSIARDAAVLAATSGRMLYLFDAPLAPSTVIDVVPDLKWQWYRGDNVVISGLLRTYSGEPLAGRSLSSRPLEYSTPYTTQTTVTDADGRFEFIYAASELGGHWFDLVYEGETGLVGAVRRVSFGVSRRPSTVTLTAPRSATFGESVRFSGTLEAPAAGTVQLVITPYGGTRQILKSAFVQPGGTISTTYTAHVNTRVTALYLGNENYARSWDPSGVGTAPRVGARISGHGDKVTRNGHDVYVFDDARRLRMHGTATPAHTGSCYTGQLERRVDSRWVGVKQWCAVLEADGTIITTPPAILKPGYYRVRGVLPADADHVRGASPWRFLRVR